jgi:hypothetical protein
VGREDAVSFSKDTFPVKFPGIKIIPITESLTNTHHCVHVHVRTCMCVCISGIDFLDFLFCMVSSPSYSETHSVKCSSILKHLFHQSCLISDVLNHWYPCAYACVVAVCSSTYVVCVCVSHVVYSPVYCHRNISDVHGLRQLWHRLRRHCRFLGVFAPYKVAKNTFFFILPCLSVCLHAATRELLNACLWNFIWGALIKFDTVQFCLNSDKTSRHFT